jgi:serine/threonine protein kinase
VLEHLEGPALSTLVRRHGALPSARLIPLLLQWCAALHYLHAEELVHLDVKPRNIVMRSPPRLIDLSVARTVTKAARLTHPVGTDAYMAPEQCDPIGRGRSGRRPRFGHGRSRQSRAGVHGPMTTASRN